VSGLDKIVDKAKSQSRVVYVGDLQMKRCEVLRAVDFGKVIKF